ncbi:MAG TPA: HWE histidine kinase domain-containing protein, partial [Bryobacteraceae bacterium]|nr:HWE histidine kinase domain-containing protein [Bryobacteraceae bacterium]
AELKMILESMGDGVFVADKEGRLTMMNPAAERISGTIPLGIDLPKARAQQPYFFKGDGKTRCLPEELPLVRSIKGENVDDSEVLVRRPGVPEVWTSATARPLRNQSGELTGAVVVVRDMTERKRHEAELEEANASLRKSEEHFKELADSHLRLAREVEHRVRNNLQGLLGLVSVMRDRTADVRSFADAIESRLAAMRHVHELLAQTRWEGVGLRKLVDEALRTLQHMACEPAEVNIAGPDIFIRSRQLLPLTMVIVEWFTNSCKYGAHSVKGGSLDIRWELIGNSTPVRVRLQWTERGGPVIRQPIEPSLGTELVNGFVKRELAGTVELRYPPQGVDHVLEFTVREDVAGSPEWKGT